MNYQSQIYDFSTAAFLAPTDFLASSIGDKQICLSWTNNSVNDNISVFYQKESQGWLLYDTIASTGTSVCVTGLSMLVNYSFYLVNNYDIYTLSSTTISATTTGSFLPPFCDAINYTISGSSCGNQDGIITIPEDYTNFYKFNLTDIFGNNYSLTDYWFSGLSSSWYFLTATPKSDYVYHYGWQSCTMDWIEVVDTDTPMQLTSTKVKPSQCLSFDIQYGRIWYNISGLTIGHTYTMYVFDKDLNQYQTTTGLTATDDFMIENAKPMCYWVLIRDEVSGCHLLIPNQCVESLETFSLSGVKNVWITPWSTDIDYNYWSTADEDYYLESQDVAFFTSTKIKEFISLTGGTLQWYIIPVHDKVVTLTQKLNKVRQGFLFEDSLDIAIAKATASKWQSISTILNPDQKWLVVILDSNDQYWCIGYRHGARVDTFRYSTSARAEDNGYTMKFTSINETKLLTSLDAEYVINHII